VFTDGSVFYVFDRFDKPNEYSKLGLVSFYEKVLLPLRGKYLDEIKERVALIFLEEFLPFGNQLPQFHNFFGENSSKIKRELKLSSKYELFFENAKQDLTSFEQLFFRLLINNQTQLPSKIYRYCSFFRAFDVINTDSIALHGLPGMNDTTEPNYVDNYINSTNEKVWEMSEVSREAINNRFIISCTTIKDELLPWRLYGEDGKGACLELKIKKGKSNSGRTYYLGRVKYADVHGKIPELEYLKAVVKRIKDTLLLDIRFVLLYVWRHFFKPYAYTYEQEVRLLYVNHDNKPEKKWLMAEPYGIINPYVVFSLNDKEFPLQISEIIVGPKKNEIDLNISQLKQLIKEKGRNYRVSKSQVQVYR
jgi:hypothetical protein